MFTLKTVILFLVVAALTFTSTIQGTKLIKLFEDERNSLDLEYVQEYLEDQMNSLDAPLSLCRVVPETLEQRLDLMARSLLDAAQGPDGDRIINGIREMINFNELQAEDEMDRYRFTESEVREYSKLGRFNRDQPASLMYSLAASYVKPDVTREFSESSDKFNLVKEAVKREWSSLPEGDRRRLMEAMDEVNQEEVAGTSTELVPTDRLQYSAIGIMLRTINRVTELAPDSLIRLTKRALKVGVKVLDTMYMAPEFFEKIPVIGEHLRELKRKGKPFYQMLRYVRASYYYLKVKGSPAGLTQGDPMRTTLAKKIIGELGYRSLKALGQLILQRGSPATMDADAAQQEFESRMSQALLTTTLPSGDSSSCNL